MRAMTPINWILGTLLLFAAVFWPVLDQSLFGNALRTSAEINTDNILKAQVTHYRISNNKYVLFKGDAPSMSKAFQQLGIDAPDDGKFLYESFVSDKSELVVRARLSSNHQASRGLPPMTYEVRLSNDQSTREDKWLELSNKKKGLGFF